MFSITNENIKNINIIRVQGDLTSDNIKLIKNEFAVDDVKIKNSIFDLEHLEMIDSTGLSYIINCLKLAIQNNVEIKLLNLNNQPKVIFEITRVDSLFELYEDEKEAISSFNKELYNESNHTNMWQSA